MLDKAIGSGKRSLDSILKEKAFKQVEEYLKSNDIDINTIDEQDLEALVDAKTKEMQSALKGIAIGGAFVALVETLI
jgi:acyl-coenzyme A thioesterase PaaI-like protein